MALLGDRDAFLQEHCRCGDLDAARSRAIRFWMTCTCGAVLVRVVAFAFG